MSPARVVGARAAFLGHRGRQCGARWVRQPVATSAARRRLVRAFDWLLARVGLVRARRALLLTTVARLEEISFWSAIVVVLAKRLPADEASLTDAELNAVAQALARDAAARHLEAFRDELQGRAASHGEKGASK